MQTIHAHHAYEVDDIVWGRRYFADVMMTLPDGLVAIDYSKFHDLASN